MHYLINATISSRVSFRIWSKGAKMYEETKSLQEYRYYVASIEYK